MARQNHGPLSRAKGKLGGVVYQQYEGMQISREYQPVVKNPQTTKQVENRAKFKLSSQIVAQFKDVLNIRLAGLSIYTRMRRAASVNAIYKIVTTATPSTPSALVSSVVAAINAKNVSSIIAPAINHSGSGLSIEMDSGFTVTYTVAGYDKTTGELISVRTETYTSTGAAKEVELMSDGRNVVMAVAYRALTESGRATISNATADNSAWQNEIARSVAAGDIETSNLAGEYAITE
ncbi:MAG: hypothetical protein IIW75_06690 [Bacteroidaceae bacterium]|nr:hypothetical protein [Bacteroidaceae bacterium]